MSVDVGGITSTSVDSERGSVSGIEVDEGGRA
jgi:hypothetical protein